MNKTKQLGGTLLGVILGMIVGLAVALTVAVYVTKVPVPFVDKGVTRNSGRDAASGSSGKADWDPNAALRRSAEGPVVGGVVPRPEPAPIPVPDEEPREQARQVARPAERDEGMPESTSVPAPAPAAKRGATASAPTTDPLGDLAAARAAAVERDPFAYFVQAGAFRAFADADAQRARLSLMGVESRITEREQAGRTVYRVRVGPLQNQDAAEMVRTRLTDNGFDAALVRIQR